MSLREGITYVLLILGVGLEAFAVLGIVAMRTVHDRLHFLAPASLGSIPIAIAICVRAGPSLIGLRAVLLVAILFTASCVAVHAIARAARIADVGDWRRTPDEGIEVEAR
jgi:multisubunit Na+/H+ antiporter MnhG subunit